VGRAASAWRGRRGARAEGWRERDAQAQEADAAGVEAAAAAAEVAQVHSFGCGLEGVSDLGRVRAREVEVDRVPAGAGSTRSAVGPVRWWAAKRGGSDALLVELLGHPEGELEGRAGLELRGGREMVRVSERADGGRAGRGMRRTSLSALPSRWPVLGTSKATLQGSFCGHATATRPEEEGQVGSEGGEWTRGRTWASAIKSCTE